MKEVAIVIFDNFTDIDLFLMWDILAREKTDWKVKILGMKSQHVSCNGLSISTHGRLPEANNADVVLFSSGKGTREVIKDEEFLKSFSLNPQKQIIASVCSGALILGKLGLLKGMKATTHPRAKNELETLGVEVVEMPFVYQGNIATAGGCLSAQYLVGWIINKLCGEEKKRKALVEIFPVGQRDIYENLLNSSIKSANLQSVH